MKRLIKFLKIPILLIVFAGLSLPMFAQQKAATDMQINNRVETELARQMNIPADDIDVRTSEDIVMLSGTVDNMLAKERSDAVAGAVRNVRGVVNEIKVAPPYVSNTQLSADVKQALLEDPAADSYEVNVKADNGMVTLSGNVQSWQERHLSAYVAKSVRGVKSLQNDIAVKEVAKRADSEIQMEIEQAIENDIRLFPRKVTVDVNKGMVSLSGTVGSLNDQHLARNYAWTSGVKEVKVEKLKIDSWADNSDLRDKKYPMRSDEVIRKAVKDAFLYDPRVLSFNPVVAVDKGYVTLSGTVSNLSAKRAAQADAQNVVGVVMVSNYLKVRPDKIPTDQDLVASVEKALMRNAEIERYNIKAVVHNGKVYLNGFVDSYYELYRAEDVASNVKGVKEVVNHLGVYNDKKYEYYYPFGIYNYYYPSPFSKPVDNYSNYPLTDAQIKTNIENELWWSPSVDETLVNVAVTDKVATLSGTIYSWLERNAAIENAYEGGAYSVHDKLIIDNGVTN